MGATEDSLETYTHIPIHVDPQTKQVSALSSDRSVQDALQHLNALHTAFKNVETPNKIPPPPVPVNPKRSAQITKLRESASAAQRKGQHSEAIRLWSFAIDMANGRPGWEPTGLIRTELADLFLGRANAEAAAQQWVEAWKDAESSTECKRGPGQGPNGEKIPGNPKAFIVAGRCLSEMGKWTEAVAWLERAIDNEGEDGEDGRELVKMLEQTRKQLERGATG